MEDDMTGDPMLILSVGGRSLVMRRRRVRLVFRKSFPGHHGRPGLRGGSQPLHAPDTGQGGGWDIEWDSLSIKELIDIIGKLRDSQHTEQLRMAVQELLKRGKVVGIGQKQIIAALLTNMHVSERKKVAEEWAPVLGITVKEFLRLYLS